MAIKKILIMAGGTGGHVFPALAVARSLQAQGIQVNWLGTERGLENDIVVKADIPLAHISISGWRGKGWQKWPTAPFALLKALLQARKIIKSINPDLVLGMGGFASGPGGLAAWLLRKPLVIQEQNSIPGLTNRVLAWLAKRSLEAFPDTFSSVHRQVILTGNPVRSEIVDLPSPTERMEGRTGPLRLLILGGSQGAAVINQVLPNALSILGVEERPEIWHQTGKNGLEEVRRAYQILGLNAHVQPFIEDMSQAYGWADLVLCRAGALTVSELAAAGVASVLIPYPHSMDNHQLHNAEYLAKSKAAVIIPQTEFSSARLSELFRKLFKRDYLMKMAEAARSLRHADATQKVVENCLALIEKKDIKDVLAKTADEQPAINLEQQLKK